MAGRLLCLRAVRINPAPFGSRGSHQEDALKLIVGNREVVGYGFNGQPAYVDRSDFPMPAIRWKETTPDLQTLREKEKGDWKQLSVAEKKALYRASFRQTFSEFKAPTGEWKMSIGLALVCCSFAIWLYLGMKAFVYSPLPDSFNEENRKAQFRRNLDFQNNPIEGLASKWDYEKNDWKK